MVCQFIGCSRLGHRCRRRLNGCWFWFWFHILRETCSGDYSPAHFIQFDFHKRSVVEPNDVMVCPDPVRFEALVAADPMPFDTYSCSDRHCLVSLTKSLRIPLHPLVQ